MSEHLKSGITMLRIGGACFGVSVCPAGRTGRRIEGGPLVKGPWAFCHKLPVELNGATAVDINEGDVVRIDGIDFRVMLSTRGYWDAPSLQPTHAGELCNVLKESEMLDGEHAKNPMTIRFCRWPDSKEIGTVLWDHGNKKAVDGQRWHDDDQGRRAAINNYVGRCETLGIATRGTQ